MFNRKTEIHLQKDLEIFAVYDSKIGSYEGKAPLFAINHHDLIRQIINVFKDPQQKQNRFLLNSEDFSVFRIGHYNFKHGVITSQNPEHIANMHDLRAVANSTIEQGGIVTT